MSRMTAVMVALTRNWVRSRSGLFFSFLFPILLLLVFGSVFSGAGSSSLGLYVQNLDREPSGSETQLSKSLIQALNSTKAFSISKIPVNVDPKGYATNRTGFLGGNIRILIVPEKFQEDVLNGTIRVQLGISLGTAVTYYRLFEPTLSPADKAGLLSEIALLNQSYQAFPMRNSTLQLIFDPSDASAPVVRSIVTSVADSINYGLIGATRIINFEEGVITTRRLRNVDYYVPSLIAAFIMTNGVIGVTSNSTEFKRRGILKRLATTPLTKIDWILGNILSQTILNLLLTAAMIAVGWLVFRVEAMPDIYAVVMIFSGSVMFSGMGMVLGGFIKDVEAASALGNAITFPMMFLSGTYWAVEFMPEFLQLVSKAMPLTYFSDGLRKIMIYQYPQGALIDLTVVWALAAVFMALGVAATRWREK